jgi:spermidine synthase
MRLRIFLAILILGVYSQIVQALLIREGLVVFYGNEISLGAFYGSWLFWLALGSLLVIWQQAREWVRSPLPWMRRLLWLLPLVLGLQLLLFRLVRRLLDVSASEFVPLDELFIVLFLITAPGGILLGVAFPLACKALQDSYADSLSGVSVISRLYVADALGALLGGVLFTFVLIQWLGVSGTLGLTALLLALAAVGLGPKEKKLPWPSLLLGLLGLLIALPPLNALLERQLEELRFATLQPGLQLKQAVETKYGHVAVAQLGEQTSVVINGQISQSFPLPLAVSQEAAYFISQAAQAQRILLFGGFAGGLASELLRYPVQRIDLVEEDRRAFETIHDYLTDDDRKTLDDPRLQLHFLDGRRYINRLRPDERFDLVLVLNATPSSAYSNRYFTREFYRKIAQHLSHDGVLCTRVSGASNYLGKIVRSFTGSVFHTLRDALPFVALAPGDDYTYCASGIEGRVSEDPAELEARYLQLPEEQQRLSSKLFYSLLQPDEISYARAQLEQSHGELNSDLRPVTYYLNMLLWGQFSASGFADWMEHLQRLGYWAYLLPLLVFIGLWLLRVSLEGFQRNQLLRKAATLSLLVLGMIAMAAQLVVLFSYQSHLGFVFERVALLNGLFMTGLALGAGLGQYLGRSGKAAFMLAGVLLLVTLVMAAMPGLLQSLAQLGAYAQEWGYLGLSLLLGLLTGCGFPLGVRITQQERAAVVRSSGITEAADNFGGALGGLLTGALMVPILGIAWTCYLLALIALVTLFPLAYAARASQRIPALAQRGYAAFPRPTVGWILTGLVLLAFAWSQAQQALQPAPQLHFSDKRLAEVSDSKAFRLVEQPFAHYLGGAEGQPAETLALSSMAAAPDVRGYGGEINLLLALDKQGLLRGVQYIDSNETPSYIAAIQPWLDGLAGIDLASSSLSLESVDALSGATVSSRAALEAINRSVRRGGELAFGKSFAPAGESVRESAWRAPGFWVILGLLLLFFPVYLSGSENGRLAFQFLSLLVLGFWLNNQVTEVDLVNLGLGHFATLSEVPQHWLLIGFSLLSALLFGPVWCGYLCPFGALQEFISRLGHHLGLRSYPNRPLDRWLRFLKYLILAALLIVVWLSEDTSWALFDPMQYAFGKRWPAWIIGISLVVLLGALFFYRFWCRYLCPVPKRRLNHCDLGVRDEFDLDCIRCNRCLTGRDTHLKPRVPRRDAATRK